MNLYLKKKGRKQQKPTQVAQTASIVNRVMLEMVKLGDREPRLKDPSKTFKV